MDEDSLNGMLSRFRLQPDFPDRIRDEALASLVDEDRDLVGPSLKKLIELHRRERLPETDAQHRFVEAARGSCRAETEYEKAYERFLLVAAHLSRPKSTRVDSQQRPSRKAKRPEQKRSTRSATAGGRDRHVDPTKAQAEKDRLRRVQRETAIRAIARRNQQSLRKEAEREKEEVERQRVRADQAAAALVGRSPVAKGAASETSRDVDEFGIPYEEGKPRPGFRPLGRFQ